MLWMIFCHGLLANERDGTIVRGNDQGSFPSTQTILEMNFDLFSHHRLWGTGTGDATGDVGIDIGIFCCTVTRRLIGPPIHHSF
jgi:hypothetical protein